MAALAVPTPAQASTSIPSHYTTAVSVPPSLGDHLKSLSSELLRQYNDPNFVKPASGAAEEAWLIRVRAVYWVQVATSTLHHSD